MEKINLTQHPKTFSDWSSIVDWDPRNTMGFFFKDALICVMKKNMISIANKIYGFLSNLHCILYCISSPFEFAPLCYQEPSKVQVLNTTQSMTKLSLQQKSPKYGVVSCRFQIITQSRHAVVPDRQPQMSFEYGGIPTKSNTT